MPWIGDKVKLRLDERGGGMLTKDSLGLVRLFSIELMDPARKQAHHFPHPRITNGSDWIRSQGQIPRSPVHYDILINVKGYDVSIDFKAVFQRELPVVRLLKVWSNIKAGNALVDDGKNVQKFRLMDPRPKWTYPYKELGATSKNIVTFINPKGSLRIVKEKVTPYRGERIAVYGSNGDVEYIVDWIHEKPGVPIENGKECRCILKLKYKPR